MDEIPPDQRAALSILLRQRKSYAQVALMLGIPEQAVHDRAHAALAVLAPRQARELSPAQREEVGDYLLAQNGIAERLRARALLESSEPAGNWARALSGELASLGELQLPEIPQARPGAPAPLGAGAPPVSSSSSASEPVSSETSPPPPGSPPISRRGGAVVIAVILIAVVGAIVLLSSGSSSHGKVASSAATSTTRSSKKSGPTVTQRISLSSPSGEGRSVGIVEVLTEAGKYAFFIDAEHLPATHGFFYAIWLYNSATSAEALSRSPAVGSSGKLAGGALLPANAREYREILLTRETSSRPRQPGPIVLRGTFSLAG